MAQLANRRYKGIEFPDNFKIEQGVFNEIFSKSHLFKKLVPEETKKQELQNAYNIANGKFPDVSKAVKK